MTFSDDWRMPRADARLRFDVRELTARQREVLDLLAHGKTNPQIAEALGITLDGAKFHVSGILERLDVASRDEAAAWWRSYDAPGARLSRLIRGLAPVWVFSRGAAITGSVIAVSAISVAVIVMAGTGGSGGAQVADLPTPTPTPPWVVAPNTATGGGITLKVSSIESGASSARMMLEVSGESEPTINQVVPAGEFMIIRGDDGGSYPLSQAGPCSPTAVTCGAYEFAPITGDPTGLTLEFHGAVQLPTIPLLVPDGATATHGLDFDTEPHEVAPGIEVKLTTVRVGKDDLFIEGHIAGMSMGEAPELGLRSQLANAEGVTIPYDSFRAGYGDDRGSFGAGFVGITPGTWTFELTLSSVPSPHDAVAGASLAGNLVGAQPVRWQIVIPTDHVAGTVTATP